MWVHETKTQWSVSENSCQRRIKNQDMSRQNRYLCNGSSTKMGFSFMSHACKQILSCVEGRVKIGEEGGSIIRINHVM
jgi:hypothetical protein